MTAQLAIIYSRFNDNLKVGQMTRPHRRILVVRLIVQHRRGDASQLRRIIDDLRLGHELSPCNANAEQHLRERLLVGRDTCQIVVLVGDVVNKLCKEEEEQ